MPEGQPMKSAAAGRGRYLDFALASVSALMVLYHMAAAHFVMFGSFEHQTIHLAFLFAVTFLGACRAARSSGGRALQIAMLALSLSAAAYVFVNLDHLENVVGFPDRLDVVVGVVLVLMAVEGTRRAWGWTLPIVATVFIVYFLLGHWLPEPLHHRQFNFSYVVSYLSIGLTGIFGTFLSISANQIILFVVFGALMGLLRINDFLYELGKLVGGRFAGGPGQTAVVASSMMGMVTGAAVANVVITGAFTIPYMKRVGYPGALAGAIEATASTGSQFMPPVMGAAAFLMAFFVGVPYAEVMVAALIPALLFYLTVIFGVQFASLAEGIAAPREVADKKVILRGLPMFFIPVAVITVLLLLRFSPAYAAFWAVVTVLILSLFRRGGPPGIGEIVRCMTEGAVVGAQIGISLCAVGLIAQTLITTGLGSKVAGLVNLLSGGNMVIGLVLTMIVSLIIGCGVPAVAAYSLVAIVAAPSLIKMGVPLMSAHFFVFYFAVISAVTPPVGLAALAAAGIAKASYFDTAVRAFKLSIAGFVIPYLVVFNPVLTFAPRGFLSAAGSLISIPLGLFALASATYGAAFTRLSPNQRIVMLAAAGLPMSYALTWQRLSAWPQAGLLFAGLFCLGWVMLAQYRSRPAAPASAVFDSATVPPA